MRTVQIDDYCHSRILQLVPVQAGLLGVYAVFDSWQNPREITLESQPVFALALVEHWKSHSSRQMGGPDDESYDIHRQVQPVLQQFIGDSESYLDAEHDESGLVGVMTPEQFETAKNDGTCGAILANRLRAIEKHATLKQA